MEAVLHLPARDGTVLLGPAYAMPSFAGGERVSRVALQAIAASPEALGQLRRQWHTLALGHPADHLTDAELGRTVARSVETGRLAALHLLHHPAPFIAPKVATVASGGTAKPKPVAPPPPRPVGTKPPPVPSSGTPATPRKFGSTTQPGAAATTDAPPEHPVLAALRQSAVYLSPDIAPILGKMLVGEAAGAFVAWLAALLGIQFTGIPALLIDGSMIAAAAYFVGSDALQAFRKLVAATELAERARTGREVDAAAHLYADAFELLGPIFLSMLYHRLRPARGGGMRAEPLDGATDTSDAATAAEAKPDAPTPAPAGPPRRADSVAAMENAIATRQQLAKKFLMEEVGLSEAAALDQMDGIDFTRPVSIVDLPPPAKLYQYVRNDFEVLGETKSANLGSWFNPDAEQTGTDIGLNDDPAFRTLKSFDAPATKALQSTAKPILDRWTDSANPVMTKGGGKQLILPDSTRYLLSGK